MALFNPIIYLSNRIGIPRIATSSITTTETTVTYTISSTEAFANNYNGLLLIKFAQAIPSGTASTANIVVTSNVGTKNVSSYGGANLTVADFNGTGIYLAYYESNTGTLQLL